MNKEVFELLEKLGKKEGIDFPKIELLSFFKGYVSDNKHTIFSFTSEQDLIEQLKECTTEEFPSELKNYVLDGKKRDIYKVLNALLKMRDKYREIEGGEIDCERMNIPNKVVLLSGGRWKIINKWGENRPFAFTKLETAKLFLKNFKEELEIVKPIFGG